MTDWFPEATRDLGNDSGTYTDTGEPKGLLHTTEGKTYAGAKSAYTANNSWPHATCTYERGVFQIWQHVPLSKPSRALRNEAGGVQTNRDNVVQLEIVGTADRNKAGTWGAQYVENFPRPYLDGIARWMRFVNLNHGVPNRCAVVFKRYPESYGANGVRLSGSVWDAYSGWLGHQHAPENTHGDPGLIDIAYLLAKAAGKPPIQEDDMAYFTVYTAPGMATRLVVDGALVVGPATELAEMVAAYKKAGYVEKRVAFAEADDYARFVHGHPTQAIEDDVT